MDWRIHLCICLFLEYSLYISFKGKRNPGVNVCEAVGSLCSLTLSKGIGFWVPKAESLVIMWTLMVFFNTIAWIFILLLEDSGKKLQNIFISHKYIHWEVICSKLRQFFFMVHWRLTANYCIWFSPGINTAAWWLLELSCCKLVGILAQRDLCLRYMLCL